MLVMNEIRDEWGVSVDNKIKDGKRGVGEGLDSSQNNFLVEVRNFTDIDQVDNTEVLALNQSINQSQTNLETF